MTEQKHKQQSSEEQPIEEMQDSGSHDEIQWNNAPNLLTLVRVALVPIVVGLLHLRTRNMDIAAAVIFGAASITDYFDGYIARTRKLITVFGKLMDPLADKFLVVSALVMLQELGRIHPFIVMILICRELAITGLRALASSEGLVIQASGGGKWKTGTQMVAIPFMMMKEPLFGVLPFYEIGRFLLIVSMALSLSSAKDYVFGFFKALKNRRSERIKRKAEAKEMKRMRKLARKLKQTPPS